MGSTHEGPAARPRGRASARSPRPARGHLTHQPVRQPDHGVADAHQYVDPRLVATEAGAVPVVADRPRSRPTRRRHRPRARAAASGSGDRLAGPAPGDRRAGGRGRADPPGQRWLASESAHIASEASGHDLHCFQALRRMDEILVANFMVFQEVVEERNYDLVIGDEAWDVDYYWHENPELKRAPNVWLTDFVGYLPMPDGGDARGVPDRRLQRRDDRAHRPASPGFGTAQFSSAEPTTSCPTPSARACRPSGTGPSSTSTSPATSPASPRPVRRPARSCAAELGYSDDERSASSTVGGSRGRRATCSEGARGLPPGQEVRTRAADGRRDRSPHRPASGFPARRASKCADTSTASTGISVSATWPSCKAG